MRKIQRLPYICDNCNTIFYRLASQMLGKTHTFCSKSCRYVFRRSGRWIPPNKIEDDQALSDLLTLAHKLQRRPTAKDIDSEWSGRSILYARRFGSVEHANRFADIPYLSENRFGIKTPTVHKKKSPIIRSQYPHNKGKNLYTDEQLIDELQRVAREIGHTPTDTEFRKHGNCSTAVYWKQFGSWVRACELAGLKPHTTFEGGPYHVPRIDYKRRDDSVVKLQGTYEYRFAVMLDKLNLDWLAHGEIKPLKYKDASGKDHRYMPDFFIPSLSIYIETKGWFREKDKIKMWLVSCAHPDKHILIIGKDELIHFERTGELPIS